MSGRARLAIGICWIIVAGVLARMAWGGNALGILYVVGTNDSGTLVAGALSLFSAAGIAARVLARPSRGTLWASVGLSVVVIPLSAILAREGHGSAVVLGGSASVALAISALSLGRSRTAARGPRAAGLPRED